MLKLLTLVGAAVTAVMLWAAPPAHAAEPRPVFIQKAAPTVSGYLGLNVGGSRQPTDLDGGGDPFGSVFAFGGKGAANMWLNPGLSLQFSVEAEGTSGYGYDGCCDYTESRFGGIGGAHLAMRSPSHALGIFGAFTGTSNVDYCGANGGALGGLETQAYLGMTTLYGQAGYGAQLANAQCGMLDRYWFVRGVVRQYLTPNLMLHAQLGYASGKGQDSGPSSGWDDLKQTSWGVGFESKMGASPVSFTLDYSGDRLVGAGTITQHTLTAGLRLNFGAGSLHEQGTRGAAFDLPAFYKGMHWSCAAWNNGC